jgi:2OG-Fe(II) oxygenase superfamily
MHIVTSTSAKRCFNESGFVDGQRLLYRKRSWNYENKKWDTTWTNHVLRLDEPAKKDDHLSSVGCSIDLTMGGKIHIQCNAISFEQSEPLKQEMLNNVILRRYPVQNRFEPRVHSLYHAKATTIGVEHDDCTPQPSYSYGSAKMKAFRLSNVPRIQALCPLVAKFCKERYNDCTGEFDEFAVEEIVDANCWNVGVDSICYRNGDDKIGFHADNDQGEEYIVTLVVDCPAGPRKIVFQPNKKIMKALRQRGNRQGQREPPVEQIELFLGSRDLYTMDKAVQQNYVHGTFSMRFLHSPKNISFHHSLSHSRIARLSFLYPGVPVDKKQTGEGNHQRLVLVFRRGREQYSKVDSGVTVNNLTPAEKRAKYFHGPVLKSRDYSSDDRVKPRIMEDITELRINDPDETNVIQYGDIVRRNVMIDWDAHSSVQGGVSGNQNFGCDSIVLSQPRGKRESSQAFVYRAKSKQGALALVASFHNQHAVRTWRSNRHDSTIKYGVEGTFDCVFVEQGRASPHPRLCLPLLIFCRLFYGKSKTKSQVYRYDGLAEILNYRRPEKACDDFVFLMCMMNWDDEKNNDPTDMEEYDQVRLRRCTPVEELDEVNDLAELVAELKADPGVRSYRRATTEAAVDGDDDDGADDELNVTHDDEDSVHEAMQEDGIVLQEALQDEGNRPGKEPPRTTTDSSSVSSKQQTSPSSSTSRKRRPNGGSGRAKKRSYEEKDTLLQEALADAKIAFDKKRERIISRFPPSYGIGDIGVVKYRNKNYVVLVCHPYHVPPSPVREEWLQLHFKVLTRNCSHRLFFARFLCFFLKRYSHSIYIFVSMLTGKKNDSCHCLLVWTKCV